MTNKAGNINPQLHKSMLRCGMDRWLCWRRGSEGSAGTYLRVRVCDGVIHQHHDQD